MNPDEAPEPSRAIPEKGKGWRQGIDPEQHLQEIEEAAEAAKEERPSIKDDVEWEGVKKRPKQNDIRSTQKSKDRARRSRQVPPRSSGGEEK